MKIQIAVIGDCRLQVCKVTEGPVRKWTVVTPNSVDPTSDVPLEYDALLALGSGIHEIPDPPEPTNNHGIQPANSGA
jgi:hypothetical protein